MEKTKYYYKTRFSADVLQEAPDLFLSKLAQDQPIGTPQSLRVTSGNETWNFDTREELLAECGAADSFRFDHIAPGSRLILDVWSGHRSYAYVHAAFPNRSDIEAIFNVFEKHVDSSRIVVETDPIKVFIGHGRGSQWRDLKDHLHDQHGLEVVAYEIGPRAGRSVKEVLEGMLTDSSFALLVLTGEDQHADGQLHARQNVVHELGLFQGRLGFTRAVALLEEGVKEFSNILGVNRIRFSIGDIRETFGDVLATIRREFQEEE